LHDPGRARQHRGGPRGRAGDRGQQEHAAELDPRGRAVARRHLPARPPCPRPRRPRRRRQWSGRMTAETSVAPTPAAPKAATAARRDEYRLRPGWITIAAKELADHVLSVRFYVLLIVLGVAAIIPMYFAGETIRSAGETASGVPAVFLYLFTIGPEG